jgi:predicted RNA binding protein YcfA (HicA-like mRNA interferase family)
MGGGRADQMKLVKALKKQGFDVERTGSGHWKVTKEGVEGCVIMAFSPSRTIQYSTLKLLEEMGFKR